MRATGQRTPEGGWGWRVGRQPHCGSTVGPPQFFTVAGRGGGAGGGGGGGGLRVVSGVVANGDPPSPSNSGPTHPGPGSPNSKRLKWAFFSQPWPGGEAGQ